MAVRFLKPSGTEFRADFCDSRLNLLAHAQAIECDLGSECGGHGICGRDRVRPRGSAVLSSVTDAERLHLSEIELRDGWRLACQCFPDRSDQEIRLEVLAGD